MEEYIKMTTLWYAFFAAVISIIGLLTNVAIASDCAGMSYEDCINTAERHLRNRELDKARQCVRSAFKQRAGVRRQSSQYYYTFGMLGIAENGYDHQPSLDWLIEGVAAAREEGGAYRIELASKLLHHEKTINLALTLLGDVDSNLAALAFTYYYLSQKSGKIDWDTVISNLDTVEKHYRDSRAHDSAQMALEWKVAARAIQIDEDGSGLTSPPLNDAIDSIQRLLRDVPQHPLANYVLGFFHNRFRNNVNDMSRLQAGFSNEQLDYAKSIFSQSAPQIAKAFKFNIVDSGTASKADELMNAICERYQQNLNKLSLMDVEEPKVDFPSNIYPNGINLVMRTTHRQVLIPIKVWDDIDLKSIEITASWGSTHSIRKEYKPISIGGTDFNGLIKVKLPGNCEKISCILSISAKDSHGRSAAALEIEVANYAPPSLRKGIVFIAGVEKYADKDRIYNDLPGLCEHDITRIEKYFSNLGAKIVRPLVNEDVSTDTLTALFVDMHDKVKKKEDYNYVLFFFSGHGGTAVGDIPCIATHKHKCHPLSSLIELVKVPERDRINNIGIIIDACAINLKQVSWSFEGIVSSVLLSAVTDDEKAKYDDKNGSCFLKGFLDYLEGDDAKYDFENSIDIGFVSISRAFAKAQAHVAHHCQNQKPDLKGSDGTKFPIMQIPLSNIASHKLKTLVKNTQCIFDERARAWQYDSSINDPCPFEQDERDSLRKALNSNDDDSSEESPLNPIKGLLVDYERLSSNIYPAIVVEDSADVPPIIRDRIIKLLKFIIKNEENTFNAVLEEAL